MHMNQGLISIITPVYNRQDYIAECIQSVLSQSYQNFEIVIVDDGSTDGTYSICKEFAEQDSRIKLLSGEHKGVSAARNMCLDAAVGEYVFFLDSDDVIHPMLLETLYRAMAESGAEIGGTDVHRVLGNEWNTVRNIIEEESASGNTEYHPHQESLNIVLAGNSPLSCIGGVMMRSDLIAGTEFRTDLHIGEDFYFIYENLIKGAACIFLEQIWYYVRNHHNNTSWDYTFGGFRTRFLRRKLVWESEEAYGRFNFAITQKKEAFECFLQCFSCNQPYSSDSKKMRDILRKYRKTVMPALSLRRKLLYLLVLCIPGTTHFILKIKQK